MFDVERLGSLSIVVVPRKLNVSHVRPLLECVRVELADDPRAIVFDLRNTDAMDMTALAGVVEAYKQCATHGVELWLGGPRPSVRSLLALTRLDRAVRIKETFGEQPELVAAAE